MITKAIYFIFSIIVVIFLALIFTLYYKDAKAEYHRTIKTTVSDLFSVRGRPNQKVAKLSDNTSMDVPEAFIPIIQVGDSILKEAHSNIYTLKSNITNSTSITTK